MRARHTLLIVGLLVVAGVGGWLAFAGRREAPAIETRLPAGTRPLPADATLSERDHERVRAAVERGEMVPLDGVLADAQRRHAGTVLEVELEGGEYEVEILGADGVIRELEYDARTGALLDVEIEAD